MLAVKLVSLLFNVLVGAAACLLCYWLAGRDKPLLRGAGYLLAGLFVLFYLVSAGYTLYYRQLSLGLSNLVIVAAVLVSVKKGMDAAGEALEDPEDGGLEAPDGDLPPS